MSPGSRARLLNVFRIVSTTRQTAKQQGQRQCKAPALSGESSSHGSKSLFFFNSVRFAVGAKLSGIAAGAVAQVRGQVF